MIERPILFSTPMVNAILEGRKNQTRRMNGLTEINKTPDEWESCIYNPPLNRFSFIKNKSLNHIFIKCPFGVIGDILYVREEYYQFGNWQIIGKTKTGKDKYQFVAQNHDIVYSDDETKDFLSIDNKLVRYHKSRIKDSSNRNRWFKRLARFMPKNYSRIKLKITNIRVQRLEDLTVTDAINEGIESWIQMCTTRYRCYYNNGGFWDTSDKIGLPAAICSFRSLFAHINGFEVLNQNPWLWVIDFEKV